MKISVRKTDGFEFDVTASEEMTVLDLKKVISAKIGTYNPIHIISKGEVVPDHITMKMANVRDGDTIHVAIAQQKQNPTISRSKIEFVDVFRVRSFSAGWPAPQHPIKQKTKEQLLAIDSKMNKFEASRKATVLVAKMSRLGQTPNSACEQCLEKCEETVIPKQALCPSEEPLPRLSSIDLCEFQEELSLRAQDRMFSRFTKKEEKKCNVPLG